jgi:hypothetical protein
MMVDPGVYNNTNLGQVASHYTYSWPIGVVYVSVGAQQCPVFIMLHVKGGHAVA